MIKGRFYSAIESLDKSKINNLHLVIVSPDIIKNRNKKPEPPGEYMDLVYQKIQGYFSDQEITCQSAPFKDRYVILLLNTSDLPATLLKFYKFMENTEVTAGNDTFSCDLSIGAVSINDSSENIYECISLAINLCEQANVRKDNKISIYKQLGSSKSGEADNIDKEVSGGYVNFDIAKAVKEGRILANYQPWVYISNDESISVKDIYDVRIELIDPDGKIIEQDERVNLLHNVFATRVIDRWMTRECITQLNEFAKNNFGDSNIKMAIKLTSDSVADPKFLTWCESLLLNSDSPKEGLLFEIDANDFLEQIKQANKLINRLRDKFGIKFVLSGIYDHDLYYKAAKDAFFDYVKLNITQLMRNTDQNFNQLVSEIKNNGSMTVAINMETADTLSLATEYSIDYIHGYLVEKPKKDVMTSMYSDLTFEI